MRTEDGYIVNKCLNGDSTAFALLVDKYKAAVYALAYHKLRNFHDAEDVTQEVFIKAYQKLRTLRRWDRVLAWLHAITYNLCRNFIRARSRRPDREFIEDQDPETLEEPSTDSYSGDLIHELINDALDSLPEMYCQVLTLHYLGGMNSREIAEFLGTSPTAIRQRLTRGRSQLKEGMLAMMNTTFEGQKLQATFTFRIVEMVKQIKIQPMPRTAGLPWGLSLTAGIVIAILSIGSHLSLPSFTLSPMSSAHTSEMAVTEIGEMPVEMLRISQVPVATSLKQGIGDSYGIGVPDGSGIFLMAPRGQEDEVPQEPTARLGRGTAHQVDYSPDGTLVAVASGVGTWLYDAVNLDEVGLLLGQTRSVAFSPDGKLMASGGGYNDPVVRIWDIQEQEQIGELRGHSHYVYSVAFSPDGKILASGSHDKTIRLWDVQEQKRLGVLRGHTGYVYSIAFSPDGKTLASGSGGGDDNTVRFWDVQEQKEIGRLKHEESIRSVAFSPDGEILAFSSRNMIYLWDPQEQKQIGILEHPQWWLWAIDFSPDGKWLASGSWDGAVRIWDVQKQREEGILQGHTDWVPSIAFAPDGKTLASLGSSDGTLRLWDVQEQKQMGTVEGYTRAVNTIAFSTDGKILASANYNGVIIWDVDKQKQLRVLKHTSNVRAIAFSRDGRTLAYGDNNGTIHLWDFQDKKQIGELKGHISWLRSLAFSPDGKILASGGMNPDSTIRFWDVEEQKQVGLIPNAAAPDVHGIAFSPDGEILASADGGGGAAHIWDVQEMKKIWTFPKCTNRALISVALSPDGRTLACGDMGGTICLWDIHDRELIGSLSGHTDTVWYVAFSPDGKWLASGSWDTTVRVWDVEDRSVVAVLKEHTNSIGAVAFSPDGKWLASGSGDGTVLLWEVNLTVPGWSVEPTGKLLGTWGKVKKTELFQNFPNPFNPETWIPYSLSKPEQVTIRIHTSTGELVRTLDLGQKPSGAYLTKEKAAYWDGRNEASEPVTSGVYFYTIQAVDDYTATKKMAMIR